MNNLPTKIIKRDGSRDNFNSQRISRALERALKAAGQSSSTEASILTRKVLERVSALGKIPTVEEVQDFVESCLFESGLYQTARAYAVYREQHARLRDSKATFVDVSASVDEYLKRKD